MLTFPLTLIDTEYTANADSLKRQWRNEHREIIQIGLLALGDNLSVLESLRVYVRPEKNPVLSAFITQLTGIRQVDVNGALPLQAVWPRLVPYCAGRSLYAFGDDAQVIADNFVLNGCTPPPECARITDIGPFLKSLCAKVGVDMDKYKSGTLCEAFGKTGARAHDALHDMKNLRLVLHEFRSRGLL